MSGIPEWAVGKGSLLLLLLLLFFFRGFLPCVVCAGKMLDERITSA
jgi:hypothetical protein